MARSIITSKSEDLLNDAGAVLLSIVQGEQLEFPVTVPFVENTSIGYTYEAVLMEAMNVAAQTVNPIVARPSGVADTLIVWVPTWRGEWVASGAYNRDDVVSYGGVFFILSLNAVNRVNATSPPGDASWTEYVPNKVYVRFPSSLSLNWDASSQPTAETKVYGFFELRITEPAGGRYQRTWKPMRGLVEFSYSPTQLVGP